MAQLHRPEYYSDQWQEVFYNLVKWVLIDMKEKIEAEEDNDRYKTIVESMVAMTIVEEARMSGEDIYESDFDKDDDFFREVYERIENMLRLNIKEIKVALDSGTV